MAPVTSKIDTGLAHAPQAKSSENEAALQQGNISRQESHIRFAH